jgi:diacylglycerol kinase family enzyme
VGSAVELDTPAPQSASFPGIETKTPAKFHGDGEILGWTPVEIEVLPQAMRMLCPRNAVPKR